MGQSRIYAMPYSHIAAYAAIAYLKARSGPTAVTLWYHHISTFRLCHNLYGIMVMRYVCLRLTYTYPYPHHDNHDSRLVVLARLSSRYSQR